MKSVIFMLVVLALSCAIFADKPSKEKHACCDEICGCGPGQSPPACIGGLSTSECVYVGNLCGIYGGGIFSENCPCDNKNDRYCLGNGKYKKVKQMSTADKEEVFLNIRRAAAVLFSIALNQTTDLSLP